MLKKLGRLYAEFLQSVRKTGDLKIQQDLQTAEVIEKGLKSKAFVDYVAERFPARTDAERKEAIKTLDEIYGTDEPFLGEQRAEFMSGYNEVIPAEEPEESKKVIAASGANLGAPVEVSEPRDITTEVAETSRRRSAGQTSVQEQQVEASGLDTSTYEKYEKLGLIGNEQATIAYLANNPDLAAEEVEFLMAAGSDAPLRPVERNGKVQLVPFPGHFTAVPLADIIDNFASSQEILNYQTFLMENDIVPQNYFASSMGEYSEELRTSIKVVMNWIDKNLYAEEGTDLYNEVTKGVENSPVYFQKTQELNGTFSFHRQLFNYGLQQMAQNAEQFEAAQEAEAARKMAQEYIPPADYILDDMVEGVFEAKLGRKPTEEELDIWSTRFAASFSIAFNQNRAKAEELSSYNFLTAQPELAGLSFEEASELQKQYPGKGMVDLSMFSVVTPEEIRAKQFEDEFGNVIEARQTGAEVRKMQQDMLTYMFGG
jgi:hypothetical protein